MKILILALVYFIAARGGLLFDPVSGFATLVWPPTGISLAFLILFGRKYWPGIFLGAFFANFTIGASPLIALGIATGNTLEAVIGATLLSYFAFHPNMRIKDALLLLLVAFPSTLVSATIGTTSLWLGSIETTHETFTAWWIGDMLGAIIITPFLVKLFSHREEKKDD